MACWSFGGNQELREGPEFVSSLRASRLQMRDVDGNQNQNQGWGRWEVSIRIGVVSRFRAALPSAQLAQLLRRSSRQASTSRGAGKAVVLDARTLGSPQPTTSQLAGYHLYSRGSNRSGSGQGRRLRAASRSSSSAGGVPFLPLFPRWHPRLRAPAGSTDASAHHGISSDHRVTDGDCGMLLGDQLGPCSALLMEQCRETSLALQIPRQMLPMILA